MAVSIPHLQFPPAIGTNGHFSVVEQDSEDDILGCVYVAVKTPIGSRYYAPTFGLNDYTFTQAPVRVTDIQADILTSEPRADTEVVAVVSAVDDLIDNIIIGVGNIG